MRLIDKTEPYMRKSVYSRLRTYKEEVEYHMGQVVAANAKATLLIRTWELCPQPNELDGFCCQDPENCQGRQP